MRSLSDFRQNSRLREEPPRSLRLLAWGGLLLTLACAAVALARCGPTPRHRRLIVLSPEDCTQMDPEARLDTLCQILYKAPKERSSDETDNIQTLYLAMDESHRHDALNRVTYHWSQRRPTEGQTPNETADMVQKMVDWGFDVLGLDRYNHMCIYNALPRDLANDERCVPVLRVLLRAAKEQGKLRALIEGTNEFNASIFHWLHSSAEIETIFEALSQFELCDAMGPHCPRCAAIRRHHPAVHDALPDSLPEDIKNIITGFLDVPVPDPRFKEPCIVHAALLNQGTVHAALHNHENVPLPYLVGAANTITPIPDVLRIAKLYIDAGADPMLKSYCWHNDHLGRGTALDLARRLQSPSHPGYRADANWMAPVISYLESRINTGNADPDFDEQEIIRLENETEQLPLREWCHQLCRMMCPCFQRKQKQP